MQPNFLLFCNLYCQFYLEKGAGKMQVDWSNGVSDHTSSCSLTFFSDVKVFCDFITLTVSSIICIKELMWNCPYCLNFLYFLNLWVLEFASYAFLSCFACNKLFPPAITKAFTNWWNQQCSACSCQVHWIFKHLLSAL